MRFSLLLLLFLLPLTGLWSQDFLSGTVLEADTGEPVPFATVYFDGTTIGQTTDEAGVFVLPLSEVELPAMLVVSHVGYETVTLPIGDAAASPEVRLRLRAQTVGAVVVQDRNRRQENLEEFRRAFLGRRDWGRNARIRNEEALLFSRENRPERVNTAVPYLRRMIRRSDRSDGKWAVDSSYYEFEKALRFEVAAREPLVVDLPDLGYTLRVDLVHFEIDYEEGRTASLGHYFFQPREGTDGKTRARHRKNRQQAYYNSPQHFLRTLQAGGLADNGYQVMESTSEGVFGARSVQPFDLPAYLERIDEERMAIRGLAGKKLIILYYGDGRGRPLPPARWKRTQPVQSGLHIGAEVCEIRADGTVGASRLYFSGFMGDLGVAYLLPSDWGRP